MQFVDSIVPSVCILQIEDHPPPGESEAAIRPTENGIYEARYTIAKTGVFRMFFKLGDALLPGFARIRVIAGRIDATASIVENFSSEIAAGTPLTMVLHARDSFSNPRLTGGDHVQLLVSDRERWEAGNVTDALNGTYFLNFTAVRSAEYTAHVVINGVHGHQRSSTVLIRPGVVSPAASMLIGSKMIGAGFGFGAAPAGVMRHAAIKFFNMCWTGLY